jgi:hypothetical protein
MSTAESMRRHVQDLVGAVSDGHRELLCHQWESEERRRWQYTPGPRPGLALAAMDDAQRDAAMSLLRDGLSEDGFATARAVMELESVLHDLERQQGKPGSERRHPEHYWFAVFGDIATAGHPWAWRVGGHHVCVHATVVADSVVMLPLFLGANPAVAPGGDRVLPREEDLGRELVLSLSDAQQAQAVLAAEAPDDILTGNAVRAELAAVPTGLPYADLAATQQAVFERLLAVYVGRSAPPPTVPVRLAEATFAWMGSTAEGEGHYYAIRAGSLFIELDNTQDGANHVHTVVRDVERDWGEDLLRSHYAARHPG